MEKATCSLFELQFQKREARRAIFKTVARKYHGLVLVLRYSAHDWTRNWHYFPCQSDAYQQFAVSRA